MGVKTTLVSVALSALFLVTIYFSVVVIFTGDWFFRLLERYLPRPLKQLLSLARVSGLWGWLRYLVLFCAVLLLVLALYRAGTPPRAMPRRTLRLRPCSPLWPWRCAPGCSPGSSACPPAMPWSTAPWPPSSSCWCGCICAETSCS